MTKRIHNIFFAILIGLILGFTAYALETRMPETPARPLPVEIKKEAPKPEAKKNSNETERMIDSGELSNHEGKYYRKESESVKQ